MLTGACTLILLLYATGLSASESHAPESHAIFEAIYDGKLKKIAGGKVRLATTKNEDGGYTFEYSIIPGKLIRIFTSGTLRETTKFEVVDGRPRALDYTLFNTVGSNPRNGHIVFDWEDGVVRGNYKEEAIDIPIPENVADRAMLQLILMADLKNDNLQEKYAAYDKDEFIPILVERIGEETIKTSVGTFSTIKLRYSDEDGTSDTVLWCAEELGYLPVRIQANDEGSEVLVANLSVLNGSPAD
jgi:hypothetical protein